jgi:hypothetical protein
MARRRRSAEHHVHLARFRDQIGVAPALRERT